MPTGHQPFSERLGYIADEAPISVKDAAPEWLRNLVVQLAYRVGLAPSQLRTMLCELLLEAPDRGNWSEFPNIDEEVRRLLDGAEWFQVYDFIEMIAAKLQTGLFNRAYDLGVEPSVYFAEKLNRAFVVKGVAWQLIEGRVESRGPEPFEKSIHQAKELLEGTGRAMASHELHQALTDLSRRPSPDVTGAIQHAMAALECVARDIAGDPNPTLGALLRKHPHLFPKPLDQGIEKMWGYASEQGRHLREGQSPSFEEAELVVGVSAVLITYLTRRVPPSENAS